MDGTSFPRPGSQAVRRVALGLLVAAGVLMGPAGRSWAGLTRRVDPAQVLPLDQLPAEFRDNVVEVIRDHTFHRQGEAESFPCNSGLYMSLVNEPALTLALWKDLAESPVQLRRLGANRYQGEDGSGTTATLDFVLRTPRLHVMLAYLSYAGPRTSTRIDARVVLILHTGFFREVNNDSYVQHDVEAFVKVDSRGWKTLARTLRPLVEPVLEEQVREAGQFISLMSRLVVTYPNWAIQVAANQRLIDDEARRRFHELVAQNRRPGASSGRPVVASTAGGPGGDTRRQ